MNSDAGVGEEDRLLSSHMDAYFATDAAGCVGSQLTERLLGDASMNLVPASPEEERRRLEQRGAPLS